MSVSFFFLAATTTFGWTIAQNGGGLPGTPCTPTFLSQAQINASSTALCGKFAHDNYEALQAALERYGLVVTPGSPSSIHRELQTGSEQERQMARRSLCVEVTLANHTDRYNVPADELVCGHSSLTGTRLHQACSVLPSCNEHNPRYRTYDGSCNNIQHPKWGKADIAFDRLLPEDYADDIQAPRRRKDGTSLPSARLVSNTLIPDVSVSARNTLLLMTFGQFLDHDLTFTPHHPSKIKCCDTRIPFDDPVRRECLEIDILRNDFFATHCNIRCMEFTRSLSAPKTDCRLGARQQMNGITSYIDASMVYGSDERRAAHLRTMQGGTLKTTTCNGRQFPPFENPSSTCDSERLYFLAGEDRTSENVQLSTLQTMFLREHNLIASELFRLNPNWDDETVYQETRRIVGAELQNIVYGGWLPKILGNKHMTTFGLKTRKRGYFEGYDKDVPATVWNSFAAAAFRFGHSLVPGAFEMFNHQMQRTDSRPLNTVLNNARVLVENPDNFGQLTRGLVGQACQRHDNYMTKEVTQRLFSNGKPCGLDLAALNIQRGRDHGLPSYNEFRKVLFGPQAKLGSFKDGSKIFLNSLDLLKLENLYGSVDEADLFPMGISEKPVAGGVVGPTFAYIIASQFQRLKKGDRFYFENSRSSSPYTFSPGQLRAIREWGTMARIMCTNGDINRVLPDPFGEPDRDKMVDCVTLPKLNLQSWAE